MAGEQEMDETRAGKVTAYRSECVSSNYKASVVFTELLMRGQA